jgi:cytochrome c-type biogenesis protein CcsB
MDRFASFLFSMRMMSVGLIIFLVAIARATILESEYGIQTAKLLIYNAIWFEILLVYLSVILISNIINHKMYKREKIASFTMHVSFLIIMIGAGVTRFVSFEGLMLVREGETADFIYSSDPYLWFRVNDGKLQYTHKEKMFQSEVRNNDFGIDFDFPNSKEEISVEFVKFEKNCVDSLVVNDSIKGHVLEFVSGGMNSSFIEPSGFLNVNNLLITYNGKEDIPGVRVRQEGGKLYFISDLPAKVLAMTEMRAARANGNEVPDSAYQNIPANEKTVLQTATLYNVGGEQFVFKGKMNHAKKMRLQSPIKDAGADYLTVKVSQGDQSKIVSLEGGMGKIPAHEVFDFNGLTYEMEYGAAQFDLPFSVLCRDFQLDRYPGSNSPSSFASELTIIDPENNKKLDKRVFMNNVIDYKGFRMFQSGYDPDEKGTRLSVNHDWWGTQITYLGYLLMAIGMILTLMAPAGRFKELRDKLAKIRARKAAMMIMVLLSFGTMAQEHNEHDGHDHSGHDHATEINHSEHAHDGLASPQGDIVFRVISEEHSDKMANLPVQDFKGRIIPLHTLCDQLMRKMRRSNQFEEYNAIQTIVSMHMYPSYWMDAKVIYVSSNLWDTLGITEKYCSYSDLIGRTQQYKLEKAYNTAFQKAESKRGEFEKKLIKLTERFQVLNQIFSWSFMSIVPIKGEANNSWTVPFTRDMADGDAKLAALSMQYFESLDSAAQTQDYVEADKLLESFKKTQKVSAGAVMPSESILNTEVSYNKMNIFKNASYIYLLCGLALLIIYFGQIFKKNRQETSKLSKYLQIGVRGLLGLIFLYHASGLGMRWIITGHAPWSNGYEAVVFIALVTMIAGFIFSRKNIAVLAGTAILAFLMIFVTEMNLMDPEITPLQPVLKSYWLMIHVAIITGSYGFLGLSCILSILNLILFTLRKPSNGKWLTLHISELTFVSEMTMTVGLFMLTIGTFLGGIWANESWGRYWGWDPKETWALVSVLVYAVILHLRFIPKMKSRFTFNLVGMWGYGAILFTFFGVNFYLVGLHSYAQGEGLGEIPFGLKLTVLIFIVFSVFAGLRNLDYKKKMKNEVI